MRGLSLLLLLIALPAYAAPECTDASYSEIDLRVLYSEWKEVVADKERVCIIARMEWVRRDNRKKLEVANLMTQVQENYILNGSADLSKLDKGVWREALEKCSGFNTGKECVVALYGRLDQDKRLSWIIRTDRLEW